MDKKFYTIKTNTGGTHAFFLLRANAIKWLEERYEVLTTRWSAEDVKLDREAGTLSYMTGGWTSVMVIFSIREIQFADDFVDRLVSEMKNQIDLTYDPETDANAMSLLEEWNKDRGE